MCAACLARGKGGAGGALASVKIFAYGRHH